MYEMLKIYFSYPFVRYAMLVGVLIALSSSLLGVSLVLKRYSFIGDGLSHVAFGAMAVATVLDVGNDTAVVLPVTVLSAVLVLRTGQNARLKGDAAIAMISVGALAFGYLFLNLFSRSANLTGDVCSTLFGSTAILTLSRTDVWLCIVLSGAVVLLFTVFYHQIFAVTFDETFARASGMKADRYNLLIAVVTASVIVLAMKLVGSLLRPSHLPGALRHADLPKLPGGYSGVCGSVRDLRGSRDPAVHPFLHACGGYGGMHGYGGICTLQSGRRTAFPGLIQKQLPNIPKKGIL